MTSYLRPRVAEPVIDCSAVDASADKSWVEEGTVKSTVDEGDNGIWGDVSSGRELRVEGMPCFWRICGGRGRG